MSRGISAVKEPDFRAMAAIQVDAPDICVHKACILQLCARQLLLHWRDILRKNKSLSTLYWRVIITGYAAKFRKLHYYYAYMQLLHILAGIYNNIV